MKWHKKGLIYTVNQKYAWNQTHAQCPVVDTIDNIWRIYFATRSKLGKSQITYIEVKAEKPQSIIYEHDQYLFNFGKIGTFDDSGIMPSCIVTHEGVKYLYYIGWTTRQTVPYSNSIGLAISEDGGKSFYKPFEGSILASTHLEPYFTGTSFVIIENGIWRMWYLSCTKWEIINGKPEPFYNIKYAESKNGIIWDRANTIAIRLKDNEGGIVSASVVKNAGIYKMWYGYRKSEGYRENKNNSYRIGYAESVDGIIWQRLDDQSGIDISEIGWDAEMISYPYIVESNQLYYMFYNGNGFGKTGFGYATTDK